LTDTPAAAAPHLVGRERALALTRELLFSAEMDVDVIGPRRSGRSSIVDAMALVASSAQRPAVRVNGVRSLATTPLAALHAAGLGGGAAQERRAASPLQHAIDALTEAVARSGGVVLVDDADLVDDASTGAIDAVRRVTGASVLRTRARPAVASDSGHVVELQPLSYDELAAAVAARLGAPLDATTMSRLYAFTFGNVGVALSTVQVAAVEGTLARRDGIWTADGELWSPSLRGLALDQLAHLTPAEKSAAEVIALASADEAAALCERRDAALEGLLTTGIVKTIGHGGRNRLVLDPPLLSEHFRRGNETAPVPEALFARLVHDEADARRAAATAEWHRSPTPRSALALARALMAPSGLAPGTVDDLDAVLESADEYGDDPLALLALAELRARRALGTGADLARASAALHDAVTALGPRTHVPPTPSWRCSRPKSARRRKRPPARRTVMGRKTTRPSRRRLFAPDGSSPPRSSPSSAAGSRTHSTFTSGSAPSRARTPVRSPTACTVSLSSAQDAVPRRSNGQPAERPRRGNAWTSRRGGSTASWPA
jgi:hypothetical protein